MKKKKLKKRLKALEKRAFNECVGKEVIDRLDKRDNELREMISNLGTKYTEFKGEYNKFKVTVPYNYEMDDLRQKIDILMNRTNTDYTEYSSEAQVAQRMYNRMCNRGATRAELDIFRNLIHKYDACSVKYEKEESDDGKTTETPV